MQYIANCAQFRRMEFAFYSRNPHSKTTEESHQALREQIPWGVDMVWYNLGDTGLVSQKFA